MSHFSQQNKREFKELVVIFLAIILLSSSLFSAIPAFAGVTFDVERKNLSNDAANSKVPEITANATNVYVVWYDGSFDIRFTNSTDSGVTFDSSVDLGDTNTGGTVATTPNPQILQTDNNNIFVVWHDGTAIKFINSTNNGDTFNTEINLGDIGSATKASKPKITNS